MPAKCIGARTTVCRPAMLTDVRPGERQRPSVTIVRLTALADFHNLAVRRCLMACESIGVAQQIAKPGEFGSSLPVAILGYQEQPQENPDCGILREVLTETGKHRRTLPVRSIWARCVCYLIAQKSMRERHWSAALRFRQRPSPYAPTASIAGPGVPFHERRTTFPCATDCTAWGTRATKHVPLADRTDGYTMP